MDIDVSIRRIYFYVNSLKPTPPISVWSSLPVFQGEEQNLPSSPEGLKSIHNYRNGEVIFVWISGAWLKGTAETLEAETARLASELVLLRANLAYMGLRADRKWIPGNPTAQATLDELVKLAKSQNNGWIRLSTGLTQRYFFDQKYFGLIFLNQNFQFWRLTKPFSKRENCAEHLQQYEKNHAVFIVELTSSGDIRISSPFDEDADTVDQLKDK